MDPSESPAGGMTALGVHMIDTLQYLLGPVARVTAVSKRILGRSALDDITSVLLEFEAGPTASLHTSLVLPRTCEVRVYGHERAAWSAKDGSRLLVLEKNSAEWGEKPIAPVDELVEQLEELALCVRDRSEPETGSDAAVSVVDVLDAIVTAARDRTWVEVGS